PKPIICLLTRYRNMNDRNQREHSFDRRVFLRSGVIFAGTVLAGSALLRGTETKTKDEEKEAEVGPPEDLMREHGVLKRVLLIYGEVLRRIDAKQDFRPKRWLTLRESFAILLRITMRNSRKISSSRVSKKPICSSIW